MTHFLTRALTYTVVSCLLSVAFSLVLSAVGLGWAGLVPSIAMGLFLGWSGVMLAKKHSGF